MTAWARWESGCGTTAARHLRWRWPCSSAAQPCSTALRHIKSAWQVLWLPGSSTSLRNFFFPAATERPCCCDYGFGSVCCVGVDGVVGGPSADSGAEPTLNDRERGRYVLAGTGTILRGGVYAQPRTFPWAGIAGGISGRGMDFSQQGPSIQSLCQGRA